MIGIKQPADQKSSYHVPALEKGLDVLELLADHTAGLTLKEIAERLGRTSQELFRMISCLVARGYLLRDEAQRLRLSTRLFELGSRQASLHTLVARALPHMQRLSEATDEPCHLSVVVQDQMLVVVRTESAADVRLAVRIGATFALHERLSGRTALAFLSKEDRQGYWRRKALAKREVERLECELAEIQASGGQAANSPLLVGGQDYTAPVFGGADRLVGVLCMSRLTRVGEQTDPEQYHGQVKACAAAISAEFGPLDASTPDE